MLDTRYDTIPRGLDEMEPGPILAGVLSSIDVSVVSGYDRIVVMRAERRMASHYNARMYRSMASVTDAMSDEFDDDPFDAHSSAAMEIRSALHLTRRATDIELTFALDLRQRLPKVSEMLSSGVIDVPRARTIERETCHLSDAAAQGVADRVVEAAPTMTTGQLAARLRRLCIDVDPGQAKQRYELSVADRRVVLEPTDVGTANLLGLDIPPHRAAFAARHVNQIAQSLRGGGETRTMDQLRADVFLDLLSGRDSDRKGSGVVDIRVDLDTLTTLVDHPGDLAGYGPVIGDIARHVVDDQHDSEWRYTVTDTRDGHPIHTGTTRRRPTADQRRQVEMRNPTCVFPGCRMPAGGCDLDHRIPWSECGRTAVEDLKPLCRHDHVGRHRYDWRYENLSNADCLWTSRLGHTYTTSGTPP